MTGSLTFAVVLAACVLMTAATAQDSLPDYSAIIASPDRTDADLQTDKRSIMSWSDANTEYRWYKVSSLVVVRIAE